MRSCKKSDSYYVLTFPNPIPLKTNSLATIVTVKTSSIAATRGGKTSLELPKSFVPRELVTCVNDSGKFHSQVLSLTSLLFANSIAQGAFVKNHQGQLFNIAGV